MRDSETRQALATQLDKPLRRRATAVVWRGSDVLLLRASASFYDVGDLRNFGLPGGGIEADELPKDTIVRELHEETELVATETQYLFNYFEDWSEDEKESADESDYRGQDHHVFWVEAKGEVVLAPEIADHVWWDKGSEVPVGRHVRPILDRL